VSRAVGLAGIAALAVGLVTLVASQLVGTTFVYGPDALVAVAALGLLLLYPTVALTTRRS
jgi:hypothetical protein